METGCWLPPSPRHGVLVCQFSASRPGAPRLHARSPRRLWRGISLFDEPHDVRPCGVASVFSRNGDTRIGAALCLRRRDGGPQRQRSGKEPPARDRHFDANAAGQHSAGYGLPRLRPAAGLAATPDGSRLFVVNHASNTLSVVDARTRAVIRSLPIGTPAPFLSPSLAISPDGARLYVLKGSTILVLDTATLGLLATLQTAASANSRDILVSPDNRFLYLTEALGRVLKLDAKSGTVLGAVPVPAGSLNFMDLTRDGSTLYVTGFINNGASNVAVHNAATLQPIATFTAPGFRPRATPDDTQVWIGGDASFAIVDRASNKIVGTFPWATGAMGMDFTPDGSQAFVSVFGGVRVVDTASTTVIDTIPIDATSRGASPRPLVFLPPPPEPPAPPLASRVRSIDGRTVTLQWQPPASGTPPASYQLEGGINPGQTLAIMPTGSSAPVFTFTAPSGSFYVRMRSIAGSMCRVDGKCPLRRGAARDGAGRGAVAARRAEGARQRVVAVADVEEHVRGRPPQAIVLDVTGSATTVDPARPQRRVFLSGGSVGNLHAGRARDQRRWNERGVGPCERHVPGRVRRRAGRARGLHRVPPRLDDLRAGDPAPSPATTGTS